MELITSYRFKAGLTYIGILGKNDPMIMSTLNEKLAIHHLQDEYDWVCNILKKANIDYTVESFTYLFNNEKFHS